MREKLARRSVAEEGIDERGICELSEKGCLGARCSENYAAYCVRDRKKECGWESLFLAYRAVRDMLGDFDVQIQDLNMEAA